MGKLRSAGNFYLFFRCWMLPKHLNRPFTMIPSLVHKASHSSMLQKTPKAGKDQRAAEIREQQKSESSRNQRLAEIQDQQRSKTSKIQRLAEIKDQQKSESSRNQRLTEIKD